MIDVTEDKREKILAAARVLFARFGFKKTSIEEIAREARIGKGTLYLYFSSKEQIYATVLTDVSEKFVVELEHTAAGDDPPADKLKAYLLVKTGRLHQLVKENIISAETFAEAMELPLTKEIRLKFQHKQIYPLIQILQEGVDRGVFFCEDIKVAAMALFVAMDTLGQPWICEGHEIDINAKTDTLLLLFLRGLLKRESFERETTVISTETKESKPR